MLFGVKLANDIYPPWRASYIDYERLKKLLKEALISDKSTEATARGEDPSWSESDESRFVEALDKELEKVYGFLVSKYDSLMARLNHLEEQTTSEDKIKELNFDNFQKALEEVLAEARQLDSFYRLNYTGFFKIVKKHDKLHPKYPSVKSLLEVRLRELPFHSEEMSPLLYRISFLYNALRSNFANFSQSLTDASRLSVLGDHTSSEVNFKSYKFWIHDDNLMEVKTRILRHLPALVYASAPTENAVLTNRVETDTMDADGGVTSSNSSSDLNLSGINSAKSYDPVLTALYFDNEQFELYNNKLLKTSAAPTVRLRWTGRLAEKPDIFLEKRTVVENQETGNTELEEIRLKMKQKFINGFIFDNDQTYKQRTVRKLKESGARTEEIAKVEQNFDSMQTFIHDEDLQPVLRAMYRRTAFQIPRDDRVRVTIDSDVLFIREDDFDKSRPIRTPKNWHRNDIDANVSKPMKFLRPGEFNKFPYSVMEIKLQQTAPLSEDEEDEDREGADELLKHGKWITELKNSHLVKEVPRFSLYVQGVASLFAEEEKLDVLPFWLPELESDIRKNPKQAYEEEKMKLKRQKETEDKIKDMRRLSRVSGKSLHPDDQRHLNHQNQQKRKQSRKSVLQQASEQLQRPQGEPDLEDHDSSDEEDQGGKKSKSKGNKKKKYSQKVKVGDTFLNILAGRESALTGVEEEEEEIELPPGVKKPTSYIKNAGPVKVEAKVWLANERTFNRWLHVTTLMSVLTFSIYNSVKRAQFPNVANVLAYIFFGLTLFCGIWSYLTYLRRLNVIRERSGKHLDAPLGPILVAVVLSLALIFNFTVTFKEAARRRSQPEWIESIDDLPEKLRPIQDFLFKLVGVENF
ncbi:VTC2 (YFL004W) and VTC3 (YPL019C) [Zygosaccharomyces parabailii]|nr:VTC2 (YFL004W) and VTC3 (YPL019C) [Zygosaccharomyces parabailii]CDH13940.1 probable VTC2-Putative polyphosphate synthetase [Zygosaccharomyces bailii ISA1307]